MPESFGGDSDRGERVTPGHSFGSGTRCVHSRSTYHAPSSELAGPPVALVDPVALDGLLARPRIVDPLYVAPEQGARAGPSVVQEKAFVRVSPV